MAIHQIPVDKLSQGQYISRLQPCGGVAVARCYQQDLR